MLLTWIEGQKKKVLLTTGLLTPAHLYIWDEPLNYIDIFSRMQLERLILECQPTMLFVEHDRNFCKNRHQGADNLVVEMSFSAQLVDVNNPEAGRKYLLNGYLKEVYAVYFLPDIPRICLTNN